VIRRRRLFVIATTVICALAATPANANIKPGHSQGNAKQESRQTGQSLESRITFQGSTAGSSHTPGNIQPTGNWTPPACWYEPESADDFAKETESGYHSIVDDPHQPNYAKSSVGQFRQTYKDGQYKNYNKDKASEGSWWVARQDPKRWLTDAAQQCDKQPFWVKNGDPVNEPNAVSPQILAGLAYKRIKLPDTKVTLAPANITKVNLPTWAWLDKTTFKPVSVTAALNVQGLNIQATTTARPLSLKLEPGTPDAATYPASGQCTFGADGSIGEPWAKGKENQDPPCGIRYLRSSGDGSFPLTATVTWQVSWTGTGHPNPTDMPNGEFGATQNVIVQEIQAINR